MLELKPKHWNIAENVSINRSLERSMDRRKPHGLVSKVLNGFLFGFICLPLQSQTGALEASHGTVNVILANKNGLVAITDSMLTLDDKERRPIGDKLYQLDERTICTVAGQYSEPVILNQQLHVPVTNAAQEHLGMFVPQIMNDVTHKLNNPPFNNLSIEEKAAYVFSTFQFRWTSNLQAALALDPERDLSKLEQIELTLAGYDKDGSLKLVEITLEAKRKGLGQIEVASVPRKHSRLPLCHLTATNEKSDIPNIKIFKLNDTLFCDVAGYKLPAETALGAPFFSNMVVNQTHDSLEQLREFAIDLERQTAASDHGVGGDRDIATLKEGIVVLEAKPQTPYPQDHGQELGGGHIREFEMTCHDYERPAIFQDQFRGMQVSANLINCRQGLDGIMFYESTFVNSHLSYSGEGILVFPDSNAVTNSTLDLGEKVAVDEPSVQHLLCRFKWQLITKGGKPLSPVCVASDR